jgi:uncharacterized protein YijF (DUF1287 family)
VTTALNKAKQESMDKALREYPTEWTLYEDDQPSKHEAVNEPYKNAKPNRVGLIRATGAARKCSLVEKSSSG